jgi:formylglycine-generating enzyme required for sulfatase activity
MAGNVLEWCSAEKASYRVIRGGGWHNNAKGCRAAFQARNGPWGRYTNLGFGVVLVPLSNSES